MVKPVRLWNEERPKFMKEHGRSLGKFNKIIEIDFENKYLKKRKIDKKLEENKQMINYEDDLIKIFKEDKDELLNTPNRPTVVF